MKFDTLEVRQWCSSVLIADDLPEAVLQVTTRYHVENLARSITAVMRLPVKVLQDDRVIAQWPAGLWDYIKCALGMQYRVMQCRMTEHLVFPDIVIPPYAKNIRLAVESRTSYGAANESQDS